MGLLENLGHCDLARFIFFVFAIFRRLNRSYLNYSRTRQLVFIHTASHPRRVLTSSSALLTSKQKHESVNTLSKVSSPCFTGLRAARCELVSSTIRYGFLRLSGFLSFPLRQFLSVRPSVSLALSLSLRRLSLALALFSSFFYFSSVRPYYSPPHPRHPVVTPLPFNRQRDLPTRLQFVQPGVEKCFAAYRHSSSETGGRSVCGGTVATAEGNVRPWRGYGTKSISRGTTDKRRTDRRLPYKCHPVSETLRNLDLVSRSSKQQLFLLYYRRVVMQLRD